MQYYSEFFPLKTNTGIKGTTKPVIDTEDLIALQEVINHIADDSVITPDEKIRGFIPLNEDLEARYSSAFDKATMLSLQDTQKVLDMIEAYEVWTAYRDGLTEPTLWSDTSGYTDVNRAEFTETLNALINKIAEADAYNIPTKADQIDYIDPVTGEPVTIGDKITETDGIIAGLINPDTVTPTNIVQNLLPLVQNLAAKYDALVTAIAASNVSTAVGTPIGNALAAVNSARSALSTIVDPIFADPASIVTVDVNNLNVKLKAVADALEKLDALLKVGAPTGTNVGDVPAQDVADGSKPDVLSKVEKKQEFEPKVQAAYDAFVRLFLRIQENDLYRIAEIKAAYDDAVAYRDGTYTPFINAINPSYANYTEPSVINRTQWNTIYKTFIAKTDVLQAAIIKYGVKAEDIVDAAITLAVLDYSTTVGRNEAIRQLTNIGEDGKVASNVKPSLYTERNRIADELTKLTTYSGKFYADGNYNAIANASSALITAFNNLIAYHNTIATYGDGSVSSIVISATWNEKWTAVYNAFYTLYSLTGIPTSGTISDLVSDNKLDPNEKRLLGTLLFQLGTNYQNQLSAAVPYNITTTTLTTKYNALTNWVSELSPPLDDYTTTTEVFAGEWDGLYNDYVEQYKLIDAAVENAKKGNVDTTITAWTSTVPAKQLGNSATGANVIYTATKFSGGFHSQAEFQPTGEAYYGLSTVDGTRESDAPSSIEFGFHWLPVSGGYKLKYKVGDVEAFWNESETFTKPCTVRVDYFEETTRGRIKFLVPSSSTVENVASNAVTTAPGLTFFAKAIVLANSKVTKLAYNPTRAVPFTALQGPKPAVNATSGGNVIDPNETRTFGATGPDAEGFYTFDGGDQVNLSPGGNGYNTWGGEPFFSVAVDSKDDNGGGDAYIGFEFLTASSGTVLKAVNVRDKKGVVAVPLGTQQWRAYAAVNFISGSIKMKLATIIPRQESEVSNEDAIKAVGNDGINAAVSYGFTKYDGLATGAQPTFATRKTFGYDLTNYPYHVGNDPDSGYEWFYGNEVYVMGSASTASSDNYFETYGSKFINVKYGVAFTQRVTGFLNMTPEGGVVANTPIKYPGLGSATTLTGLATGTFVGDIILRVWSRKTLESTPVLLLEDYVFKADDPSVAKGGNITLDIPGTAPVDNPADAHKFFKIEITSNFTKSNQHEFIILPRPEASLRKLRETDNRVAVEQITKPVEILNVEDILPTAYFNYQHPSDPGTVNHEVKETVNAEPLGFGPDNGNNGKADLTTVILYSNGVVSRLEQYGTYQGETYIRSWNSTEVPTGINWNPAYWNTGQDRFTSFGWGKVLNTTKSRPKTRDITDAAGTTALNDGSLITLQGTSANIVNQGTGATANSLTQLNSTEGAKFGTIETGANVTGNHTAANIANQAVTATNSDFAVLTGDTKPSDNAGTTGTWKAIGVGTRVKGNTIGKYSGTHGVHQGAAVGTPLTGTCFITSSILSPVNGGGWCTSLALSTNSTSFSGEDTHQYCARITCLAGNNRAELWVGSTNYDTQIGNVTLDSRFGLVYDGDQIHFVLDGNAIHSKPALARVEKLYPKVLSFYLDGSYLPENAPIHDVQSGPFNDASWKGIKGADKPADNASANTRLTAMTAGGYVTVEGNTLKPSSTTADGYMYGVSGEPVLKTAYVEATVRPGWNMLALDNNGTDYGYNSQTLVAHYNQNEGLLYVYADGGVMHTAAASTSVVGETARLIYDGSKVYFTVGYTVLWEAIAPASLKTLTAIFPKIWSYEGTQIVSGIGYGPYSNTKFEALGGLGKTQGQIVTVEGTAANIVGQASTATNSDFSVLTGSTKPAPYATADLVFVQRRGETNPLVIQGNRISGGNWTENYGWRNLATANTPFKSIRMRGRFPTPGGTFGVSYSVNSPLGDIDNNDGDIAYGWHRSVNGNWYYRTIGLGYQFIGTAANGVTFSAATDFDLVIDGRTAKWLADGVLIAKHAVMDIDHVLYPAIQHYAQESITEGLRVETWGTVGARVGANGDLRLENGTTTTDAAIVTNQGTAANIANQGTLATKSNVNYDSEVVGAGKPLVFTVGSAGNAAILNGGLPANYLYGLRTGNGTQIGAQNRSYTVFTYDNNTKVWSYRYFDVYANQIDFGYGAGNANTGALAMANYLNGLAIGTPIVIQTCDEPTTNRLNNGLPEALYRCGASRSIFGKFWYVHAAYILIGTVGAGEGNGVEQFEDGGAHSSIKSWVMAAFTMVNGVLTVGGKSLKDAADLTFTNGRSINDLIAVEAGANVTGNHTAANIANQTSWATYNGLNPTNVAGQVQKLQTDGYIQSGAIYKSNVGFLIDYWPQEGGANITENRTASNITNQGILATKSQIVPSLMASQSSDNVIPDGSMIDPKWWGETDHQRSAFFSITATNNTSWPLADHLMGMYAGSWDAYSPFFDMLPGATYKIETSVYTDGNFNGFFNPALHIPEHIWLGLNVSNGSSIVGIGPNDPNTFPLTAGQQVTRTIYYKNPGVYGTLAWRKWQFRLRGTFSGQVYFQFRITRITALNSTLVQADGYTLVTDNSAITALGTSANFVGQGPAATATAAQALNSYVATGTNSIFNAGFEQELKGFGLGTIASGSELKLNLPGYFGSRQVAYLHNIATIGNGAIFLDFSTLGVWNANGTFDNTRKYGLAVSAGDRIGIRALVSCHRSTAALFILYYNATGAMIYAPATFTGYSIDGAVNGGGMGQMSFISEVPSGAVYAEFMLRGSGTGVADPYVFFAEPWLGKLAPGQAVLPPYAGGRADPLGDNTILNLPSVQKIDPATFPIDSSATTILNQQSPIYIYSPRFSDGKNVSTQSTWTKTSTNNITAAINNSIGSSTRGQLIVSKMYGTVAYASLQSIYNGLPYATIVRVNKVVDSSFARHEVKFSTTDWTPITTSLIPEAPAAAAALSACFSFFIEDESAVDNEVTFQVKLQINQGGSWQDSELYTSRALENSYRAMISDKARNYNNNGTRYVNVATLRNQFYYNADGSSDTYFETNLGYLTTREQIAERSGQSYVWPNQLGYRFLVKASDSAFITSIGYTKWTSNQNGTHLK